MTIASPTGVLDEKLGYVVGTNDGGWADLTTWADWTSYKSDPSRTLTWLVDPIDLGSVKTFALTITTNCNGVADWKVYTSDTGEFDGEETETVIVNEETSIPAFTGRYVVVEVTVNQTTLPPELYGVEVQVSNARSQMSIDAVDTTTLDGTIDSYLIPLPKTVGAITNILITPREVPAYNMDVYVTNTPTSTTVVPRVTDTTAATPAFALVGMDNHPKDGVVDIKIEYLPEMYIRGNNILVR
jgi:hypothetical protein